MAETRKLAAILAADVAGYSKLAAADEERTLARLRALRSDLIDPTIAVHHGRVVKRTGDGIIVEFRSVVDGVRCAIEVQNGMAERNAGLTPRLVRIFGGFNLPGGVSLRKSRRRWPGPPGTSFVALRAGNCRHKDFLPLAIEFERENAKGAMGAGRITAKDARITSTLYPIPCNLTDSELD
jgi:hypothetical protein